MDPTLSMQVLNAYAQDFVPVQYPASVPQSGIPQQVPQYAQNNVAPCSADKVTNCTSKPSWTRPHTHHPSQTATIKLMEVVPRGQGTTQNDVIEHDPELSIETEIDKASANNLSQYPVANPSCETGVFEPSSSKPESIGANNSSSVHQVGLQSRGLTQDIVHRQLPVYCRAYVDRFVQGVDATLTVDTGAVNSLP